jgi:hypothetical protein
MARSLSAITVGAVTMETATVITTLFPSVVDLTKHLVLVNAWREILKMTSIKPVLPLVGVVEAELILLWTRTKQAVSNFKCAMT